MKRVRILKIADNCLKKLLSIVVYTEKFFTCISLFLNR